MKSLNIIFPVLNEENRLERGIRTTIEFVHKYIEMPIEINIVDNGSIDKTETIALALCEEFPELHYTKISEIGLGVAFREGVNNNNCDYVGYMDIDLATNLKHLVQVQNLFIADSNLEFINGSRFHKQSVVTGRKWYRNITSYGLLFMLHTFLKMKATDSICGFKFFKKETAESLIATSSQDEKGWFLIIEMLLRAERTGVKIHELPVEWHDDAQTSVRIMETIKNYIENITRLYKLFNNE